MSSLSHCQQCGRRLRDVYFCPLCGQSQCCFACLDEHLARHGILAANRVDTARSAVEDADFPECPKDGIEGALGRSAIEPVHLRRAPASM
jgi:hypothetical protein